MVFHMFIPRLDIYITLNNILVKPLIINKGVLIFEKQIKIKIEYVWGINIMYKQDN
jgi:hypothetical protein